MFVNTSWGNDQTNLIKQGPITIDFEDIDGYALTIPPEKREEFFFSAKRIDTTLTTLVKMKHIENYAKSNKILDDQLIKEEVNKYMLEGNNINISGLTDIEYLNLKKHLTMKLTYTFMHFYYRDLITDNDVIQLAKEEYLLNKDSYYHENLREIEYINIRYNNENKKQQKELAKVIKKQLQQNNLDFSKVKKEYDSIKAIEFIQGIKDFYYNDKYAIFSDFVFKPKKIGIIQDILDAKSRFIVAIILKITPKGYRDFEEVKVNIISELKKDKLKRDFGGLMGRLTKDPIIVNKENIISLQDRYIN